MNRYGNNKGEKMKKLMICMFLSFFGVFGANATSLCAKEDVIVIALDPSQNGKSGSYSDENGTWNVEFSYGAVSGVAADLAISGSGDNYTVRKDLDAVGGETTGRRCWCKMTHPMESGWVNILRQIAADNTSTCPKLCQNRALLITAFRDSLFGSVGE